MIAIADKAGKPVLRSKEMTARFLQRVMMHCDHLLGPAHHRSMACWWMYGVGIMLMGDSGIGKSETALSWSSADIAWWPTTWWTSCG